jgi:two-component sensor histidine kinase
VWTGFAAAKVLLNLDHYTIPFFVQVCMLDYLALCQRSRIVASAAPLDCMQTALSLFQRRQLEVIARVTPHSMTGHILNTTVLAIAVAGSIPTAQLAIWSTYSYAIALLVLYRHMRNRGRMPRNFQRATRRATLYACFLALPWSVIAVLYMGQLAHDQELILVALIAGMAASGSILLSALPLAAFSYMSGILIPSALKSFLLLNKGYLLLGVLVLSYWWFLAALLSKVAREISERKRIDVALKEGEVRLQQTLQAGQMVAFTWDAGTSLSRRSENASQILGLETQAANHGPGKDFLSRLHADDRKSFFAQINGLCPERPSYSAFFRFIRPDAREVWLEETGKAEFDAAGRCVRIKGLTCDVTEGKRAEEQQRFLARELDHRVKNVFASAGAVAQRTGEGSGSIDEFLQRFDGRIQSLASAHALLSRSHWEGVRLADLVHSELEPCVRTGGASVEGPNILLLAEATQPIAIALHELVTNALKYGALSSQRGHITVRWQCQSNGHAEESLLIEWIETGGPVVVAPKQPGYGIRAIRSLIPYELCGSVDLVFDPAGVRCRIEVPCKRHNSSEPIELFKASDSDPSTIAMH